MRLWVQFAGLMLPALIAWGDSPAEKPFTSSVAVFMDFDTKPWSTSVEVMKKEVNHLLKPSGVTLDWRLTRDNEGKESFAGLVVLKFKGRCRAEAWTQPEGNFGTPGETVALGSTQVVQGEVLPFTEVECDQVRKALKYLQPGAKLVDRQMALGMALGRVVAHELYHILARTTGHATAGMAKASQSLRDLVGSREIPFQESDFQAIGNGASR